ncbi:hypothetical protein N7474_002474 [Penicillium riverlandense]|uniref:uncharacterized protein n=1 Tax=Penicillium riverlandense TaxID=1903569 RepID=UPI002546C2FB|nr:uncharacterized protein N7474_002474 [Penicillium riverlandense]KAJ5825336.1 hypothetical protein N7474_002474 [Penicillium riverlandense]
MEPSLYQDFTWNQVKPGRWERDVDEIEQFYTTLARRFQGTGKTFFAMTAHVSFSVKRTQSSIESHELYVTSALQKAWLRLRYDHPTIASWVEYDREEKRCKKVYEMFPDPGNVHGSAWLKETFRIVSTSQSCQDWCNSDPPVPKLPTLFVIKQPTTASTNTTFSADVVLRSQHDIIDGIGSLYLLNSLFKYAGIALDDATAFHIPSFGDEWTNLSPPFRVAASLPASLTVEQETRLKQILKKNASLRQGIQVATIPVQSEQLVPGRHQRVSLSLDSQQTQKLLVACKSVGASVTHVYHAAIALVLRDAQERYSEERNVRYISYSLINERAHCKAPYNTSQHAVTVYHSASGPSLAIDLRVPAAAAVTSQTTGDAASEFAQVLELVRDYYLGIRNDPEHVAFIPSYWKLSTPPYPDSSDIPPIPSPNKAPSVSISSLGVIDNIISPTQGLFELDVPWVTGEELGTGLGLFLGTFRGRTYLSAAYNDAWHNETEVMEFLSKCNSLVFEAFVV